MATAIEHMKELKYQFSSADCTIYPDASFAHIAKIAPGRLVVITDENIFALHKEKFDGHTCIVISAGEQHKNQATVDRIINELIALKADRGTFVAGVGGGVVTDMSGYVASIYMRGLRFGFVPTSILAMVDASVGGKNGIDVGLYKNMLGTIRQPEFILYDLSLLQTLPDNEWINGFAEIIKHACIKDAAMFDMLAQHHWQDFKHDADLLSVLIEKNIAVKAGVVLHDEFEKGERKLLNFGHTVGHAIENLYALPHGHAVSIGMVVASAISQEVNKLPPGHTQKIIALLQQYELPVRITADTNKLMQVLLMDKKRSNDTMNFILLDEIGKAIIQPIDIAQLTDILERSF
jgi:3-dehydroquinate synthase